MAIIAIMMENINNNWASMTDSALISVIGTYIKHQRLGQNKTQEKIAYEAGINRGTLVQIENGESIRLSSLIQILRALDLLYLMDNFIIEDKISPIQYAKLQGKKRKRASSNQNVVEPDKDLEW